MKKIFKNLIVSILLTILIIANCNTYVYGEGISLEQEKVNASELYVYSTKDDGTIKLTGVTEKFYEYYYGAEELILPDTINGVKVTSVLFKLNKIETLKVIELPSNMKAIGSNLFEDCTNLEKVILPEGLTAISENAFYNCPKLLEIKLPETLTTIADSAFASCSSLKKIEIPEKVTKIKANAFQNCTSLKSVKLNNTTTTIYENTFEGCTSLEEIEIPIKVTKIKAGAFSNCTNLKKLTIKNRSITFESNIFENVKKLTIVGYKNSTAQNYAQNNGIKFEEIVGEISQVEKVGMLMSAFAKECVNNYSTKFYYYGTSESNRHNLVFNNKSKVEENTLKLDCVGTLNLFIYQSTGLFDEDMYSKDEKGNKTITSSYTYYVAPRVSSSGKLRANDLFEYILDTSATDAYTKEQLIYYAQNGYIKEGDIIMLDGHVTMYCGWDETNKKMLCPEAYDGHRSLYFSNFGGGTWGDPHRGAVLRIKEKAANELTFLYDLNTETEIEAYAKKLVEDYMKGNGKIYTETKIQVGDSQKQNVEVSEEEIEGVEIKTLTKVKGMTVKKLKESKILEGYDRVEVLDENGNVIEDEETRIVSTGIDVRCYRNVAAGNAVEIRAGGETEAEELVDEYVVVIYGDVTGKGNPSAIDALAIVKNKTTNNIKFKNEIYEIAGRVSQTTRDNKETPTAVDALMIIQERLGKIIINQGKYEKNEPTLDEESEIIPIYTREDLEKVGSGEEWLVESIDKIYTMKTDSKYILMRDIDLSDKPWTPIGLPELKNEEGEVIRESTVLTNTFEGNNHKITGMTITGKQSLKEIGLFAVSSANIKHLKLENVKINNITFAEDASTVLNEVNRIDYGTGILVGYLLADDNTEDSKIVISKCEVSGETSDYICGGIVGKIYGTENTVYIENCINNAKLDGAGIAKSVYSNINILNCKNNANINGAGFICDLQNSNATVVNSINNGDIGLFYWSLASGFVSNIKNVKISMISCTNTGNITDGSGFIQNSSHSDNTKDFVKINKCTNKGKIIRRSGVYEAGICGNMYATKELRILNTTNLGNIQGSAGILAYTEASIIQIENCENYGNLRDSSTSAGIVKEIYSYDGEVIIKKCNNYGKIETNSKGAGIVSEVTKAKSLTVSECKNAGEITSEEGNTGGIIGFIYVDVENIKINDCTNEKEGKVIGNDYYAGGIVGSILSTKGNIDMNNNINKAEVISKNNVGGIVGGIFIYAIESVKIKNCTNMGNVSGDANIGGIVGLYSSKNGIANKNICEKCINKGMVSANERDKGEIFGKIE